MSSNQFFIDAASRHAIFVQRFSAGFGGSFSDEMEAIIEAISEFILDGNLDGVNTAFESYPDLTQQIIDFADSESEFFAEMVNQGSKANIVPLNFSPEIMTSIMDVTPQPMTMAQAVSTFSRSKRNQIQNIVSDGILNGRPLARISKDISNITPLVKRQSMSLVRTLTNATTSNAARNTYAANDDVLLGYEWVSTLDSLTSFICMSRDGLVYPFSDNSPLPPAHWSCRSTVVPKVKPEFDLLSAVSGKRPSVGADGAQLQSARVTYSGWLRKQPARFQDEALGPARAKLFRAGKLSLEKFVDNTGQTYNLRELRALNPMAFERSAA